MKHIVIYVLIVGNAAWSINARAASDDAILNICVKHFKGNGEYFDDMFSRGAIAVPAGSVFDYAGHVFGSASDPKDEAHEISSGWRGISKEETKRRNELMIKDLTEIGHPPVAIVTLKEVKLTKSHPCGRTQAAAAISEKWRWTTSPVFGTTEIWYQLYGVTTAGTFDTSFARDNPLDNASQSGFINGVLEGTTSRDISVPD